MEGRRAGFDAVEMRNISCPSRESKPGRPACSPLLHREPGYLSRYSDWDKNWMTQESGFDSLNEQEDIFFYIAS
jgi:hypothetical protein